MSETTEQRSRDLECDRVMSAGLCMASLIMAAGRHLPRFAALEALRPSGPGLPIIAPFVVLGAVLTASVVFIVASDTRRRPRAAFAVIVAAFCAAFAVPFLQAGLHLFFEDVSMAKASVAVAFPMFGLAAATAADRLSPSAPHFRRSAAISVVALLMAAVDGDGIFACILAAVGLAFFAFWKERPAA